MNMRHGYYLKQRHFAYSGTLEKLRSKADRKEKMNAMKDKKKSCRRSSSHRTTGLDRTSGA